LRKFRWPVGNNCEGDVVGKSYQNKGELCGVPRGRHLKKYQPQRRNAYPGIALWRRENLADEKIKEPSSRNQEREKPSFHPTALLSLETKGARSFLEKKKLRDKHLPRKRYFQVFG